jgi:hypothetical protein
VSEGEEQDQIRCRIWTRPVLICNCQRGPRTGLAEGTFIVVPMLVAPATAVFATIVISAVALDHK